VGAGSERPNGAEVFRKHHDRAWNSLPDKVPRKAMAPRPSKVLKDRWVVARQALPAATFALEDLFAVITVGRANAATADRRFIHSTSWSVLACRV
jgi:hypothetical protein